LTVPTNSHISRIKEVQYRQSNGLAKAIRNILEYRVLISLYNEIWKKIEQKIKHMCLDFNVLVLEPLISSYIIDVMIQTGLLG
jgi:hypothetical protein